jgi:hypothetical protein
MKCKTWLNNTKKTVFVKVEINVFFKLLIQKNDESKKKLINK